MLLYIFFFCELLCGCINCVIHSGETPLHLAARYQRADATKKLLDAGADPKARDNCGRTPLHAAVAADARGVFQVTLTVCFEQKTSTVEESVTILQHLNMHGT